MCSDSSLESGKPLALERFRNRTGANARGQCYLGHSWQWVKETSATEHSPKGIASIVPKVSIMARIGVVYVCAVGFALILVSRVPRRLAAIPP